MSKPINILNEWFKTGKKPTQEQFWELFDSYHHKDSYIPINKISELDSTLQNKVDKSVYESHLSNADAHSMHLAKLDASNLSPENITSWKDALEVGSLPANIATVDDLANAIYGNVWSKQQSDALYMIADEFVHNGKIRADKIEALGLTELITVTETSLAAFMANNANYVYEKNDIIAIPDGLGNYSLYIYRGGSKTTAGNYLPTGLTNITIGMVQGLQAALDQKLNRPVASGNYFINHNGTTGYKEINPAPNYLLNWNGTDFLPTGIYNNSGKYGIGTTTPSEVLHLNGGRVRTKAIVFDETPESLPYQITYTNRRFWGADLTGYSRMFMYRDFNDYKGLWLSLSDAEKTEIKTIANGGWTTNTMSVAIMSPTVVDAGDKPTWVTLRGANLNLNPTSFEIAIVDLNGSVLAIVPNSQVQLYSDGVSLTFWYNFKNLPLGEFKIRLWNGVAFYTTSLKINMVTTVNYVNMSGWNWESKIINDAVSNKLNASGSLIGFSPDSNVYPLGLDGTKIFKVKSPQISGANENFYLEMTVSFNNFLYPPGPTYGFGISSNNNVGTLVDDFIIAAQMYSVPLANPAWVGLNKYYFNSIAPVKVIFYKLGNTLNKIIVANFGSGDNTIIETTTVDPTIPLYFGATFSQSDATSRSMSISLDVLYKF